MQINFHDMWLAHAASVCRYAQWLCGDAQMARDITAETFVRAWTSPTPKRAESLRGYLLTVARHLYLEWRREQRRTIPLDQAPDQPDPRTATSEVDARFDTDRAMVILQGFPEDDRTALLLRLQEELSYEEIATILGISPATARVKVHRARMKLQTLLNSNTSGAKSDHK